VAYFSGPPCIVKITLEVVFAVAARNRRKTRNARETSLRSASHVSGKRGIARICCRAAGRAAVDPSRPMAADTAACSVRTGQTDGRTDGRTPYRYIGPAPRIMRAAPQFNVRR